ncbi:protein FAM91A1 [Bacillus rossius redtenbacheri]|uniref:protein FAM91A1 n=1 Tax=Bacillus rossius redtenbacheri TaxID=93214 RepID=UPI002FDC981B
MNSEVEFHVRQNYPWEKVPVSVKQSLGNSQKEYEKCILGFSVKNQLRYRGNLVSSVCKDERRYYKELLAYSKDRLMLFPYHLSDVVVQGLRVTPFQYYVSIMETIMDQEKSYDSLPNFTAADCLRLLGIGRNEYIELMNQCRSGRKLFRRKNVKDLMPSKPVDVKIDSWWYIDVGYVIEDDIKVISPSEQQLIDRLIDHGRQRAGDLDQELVHRLYKKGLVYVDVPIEDDDHIVVPPLEGFVMNRVLGDYFETLLYKIFVSIDERTSVGELAGVLQIDPELVKNAVSLYCRLGFALRKGQEPDGADLHPSWREGAGPGRKPMTVTEEPLLLDLNSETGFTPPEETSSGTEEVDPSFLSNQLRSRRIAFLFDSTLTAFLMMGNLSPGLKNHAVTMFEVGKLSDESLDSFLAELEKISTDDGEGEAQRYFDHALILRETIVFLRQNRRMADHMRLAVDLIRCESLQSLDPATCTRLLCKNYALLVSMAPLSKEIRPISSCTPPHLGPAIPEVNTVWFKLFIYHLSGYGPPTLFLAKGSRMKKLPKVLQNYDRLLVTTWGHDHVVLPVSNIVFTLNDVLCHSAVLVQAYGTTSGAATVLVPFPNVKNSIDGGDADWFAHPAVEKLSESIDLVHNCGFVTMVNVTGGPLARLAGSPPADSTNLVESWIAATAREGAPVNGFTSEDSADLLRDELSGPGCRGGDAFQGWTLLDCSFGVPLFDAHVNRRICDAVIAGALWTEDSLKELTASSRKLCLRLLDFIASYQDLPVLPEETSVNPHKRSSTPSVALPTRSLVFADGRLDFWDGK